MRDDQILKRLPYHAEYPQVPAFQTRRLIYNRKVLGVITKDEPGMNLYPGPKK